MARKDALLCSINCEADHYNEDDEGWAVAMFKEGESEPALVGPWTMGRDKKNPKLLDASAFSTLVKTASEVLRRHEHVVPHVVERRVDQLAFLRYRIAAACALTFNWTLQGAAKLICDQQAGGSARPRL